MKKTCKGILYLHEKDIAHRDIKLQNILCDNDAEVIKIADFGLSMDDKEYYQSVVKGT